MTSVVPLSLLVPDLLELRNTLDIAEEADDWSIGTVWIGSGLGFDPLTAVMAAAGATARLRFGTAVVPIWLHHPLALAIQAATIASIVGERFALGLGTSHPSLIEGIYGVELDAPVARSGDCLRIIAKALAGDPVDVQGNRLTVHAPAMRPAKVPLHLAGLRKRMCRLAGDRADGVLIALPTPEHLRDVVVPAVHEGAAAAARTPPAITAFMPCVIGDSTKHAQQMAATDRGLLGLRRYRTYREMTVGDGDAQVSDADWIDALERKSLACGDIDTVQARAQALADAGATEIALVPFGHQRWWREAIPILAESWRRDVVDDRAVTSAVR